MINKIIMWALIVGGFVYVLGTILFGIIIDFIRRNEKDDE